MCWWCCHQLLINLVIIKDINKRSDKMKIIDERELFIIQKENIGIVILAMNLREAVEEVFKSRFSEDSEDKEIHARKMTDEECLNRKMKGDEVLKVIDEVKEIIQPNRTSAVIIDYWGEGLYLDTQN